jgi:hypothetical protein
MLEDSKKSKITVRGLVKKLTATPSQVEILKVMIIHVDTDLAEIFSKQ